MSIAALVRSMAVAGAPPEAIALAVEAVEAAEAKVLASKANEAARSRRYRERGGGKIPEEMRQAVFERDSFSCRECGSGDFLQCDHVHPVSKGGETTMENLQALCRVCNARKRDRIRKADVRGMSVDINQKSEAFPPTPPPLSFPPQTPLTIPPRPEI